MLVFLHTRPEGIDPLEFIISLHKDVQLQDKILPQLLNYKGVDWLSPGAYQTEIIALISVKRCIFNITEFKQHIAGSVMVHVIIILARFHLDLV